MFAKLPTDKASGMLKPLERRSLFGFTTYPTDIDTSVTQIGRDVDSRNGRQAQPWVLKLA